MSTLPMISAQDGFQVTINEWLKDVTTIPLYVLNLMDQGFLADAVLRPGPAIPSGVAEFHQTTPLYADSTVVNRSEFGEVPAGVGSLGQPNVVFSVEKSMAVVISDWMVRRNKLDTLGLRMAQVKNSITRAWDDVFVQALTAAAQTGAASAHWNISNTDIRSDIITAMKAIATAADANGSILGYQCDTMIVNQVNQFDIIRSTQFNTEYYGGDIADQNLRYTGLLPQKIMGLNTLVSPRVPAGTVLFLQRGATGFISDEVPLNSTPMYRDEPRKTQRCDIARQSAVGIDQPLSAYVLTGTT